MNGFDVFNGPAAGLLKGNKFADVLKAVASDRNIPSQDLARTQISFALNGNGKQCDDCKKFVSKGKLADKHESSCERDELIWKYGFLKLKNRSLFCYFGKPHMGCEEFPNRALLCRHLL